MRRNACIATFVLAVALSSTVHLNPTTSSYPLFKWLKSIETMIASLWLTATDNSNYAGYV